MIKDKEGLTAYFSKVKMTDESKLKKRTDEDKEVFFKDIE